MIRPPLEQAGPTALHERLSRLRESCLRFERSHARFVEEACRAEETGGAMVGAVASTRNLLHYLALRREDLRELHTPLAELGVSSLGRIEPHVMANLNAVIDALAAIAGAPRTSDGGPEAPITLTAARELTERRASDLLGASRTGPSTAPATAPASPGAWRAAGVRIMVTLPPEAADDPGLVGELLDAGMTCARINTAHDTPDAWVRMATIVRSESARRARDGRPGCRILMDLAGPKLRTGPIESGPEVVCAKPVRDALGRVSSPAVLTLRPDDLAPGIGVEAPIDRAFLTGLGPGDALALEDTRGRRRVLKVRAVAADGRVLTTADRTVYVGTGSRLRLLKPGGRPREGVIGRLPALVQTVTVRPGDAVLMSPTREAGAPRTDPDAPFAGVLTCRLPEAFARAKVGDPVWIDDGKIGLVVEAIVPEGVVLRVTHAAVEGAVVRADKGINLPATEIGVSGLTPDDIAHLPIVAEHADMVGLSFVHEAWEVVEIRRRLRELGGGHVGTVLKIETQRAFGNLPDLLMAALLGPCAGVMIARGDLAVEVGYDRLGEVQEEILWLCEAVHLPVIWATQVLETMTKRGYPSRAEVTDAAMGERAECVMLNKGRHIVPAVRFLDDLLRRMQSHQSKKRTFLRALDVARRFGGGS